MKQDRFRLPLTPALLLVVFCALVLSVVTVLHTGTLLYGRLIARDRAASARRSCAQYLSDQLRRSDQLDGIRVDTLGGEDALVLGDAFSATWIYWHDGAIWELSGSPALSHQPEEGTPVMEAGYLKATLEEQLLTVSVVDTQGHIDTLMFSLRGGEGAVQ